MTDMAAKILLWRESLSVMPDHHFFEIIRMYLGEIKTPYNKQKLIEDLSAFLRKEQNKQTIISLLSQTNLELVTAIKEIPSATQDKLSPLFSNGMTYASLYEQLMNLEERLIIYRHPDKNTGRIVFDINPLLEPVLLPLLKQSNLLPVAVLSEKTAITPPEPRLSPEFLAAMFSFLLENPDLCKADGTLKKRFETLLPQVFPAYTDFTFYTAIIAAFTNLSLIRLTDCGFSTKIKRWMQFAELDEASQLSYIAAAATGHFPRGVLQSYAQLIRDVLAEIPSAETDTDSGSKTETSTNVYANTEKQIGFTKDVILRNFFLHREVKAPITRTMHSGRFSSILQRAESFDAARGLTTQNFTEFSSGCTDESLFNTIEKLGLVYIAGKNADGNSVYRRTPIKEPLSEGKFASIDSGFSLTILPGLPLKKLLSLAQISVPVRYETILQLEITKSAAMRSFDEGNTPADTQKELYEVLTHTIPQSILFSFSDWYEGFSSASIFRGYVLKIQPEKDALVEKNPEFAPYIKLKLAPGVFLLDFATKKEAMSVISSSGLNFIGSIKDMHEEEDFPPFPKLYHTEKAAENPTFQKTDEADNTFAQNFLNMLNDTVEKQGLSVEQTEELKSRIQRRIIVNESQLRADSVRPEKNEASGMDFLGKIHVTEHAIASESLLNIMCDGTTYLVQPVRIEKQNGDAILKALLQPDGVEKFFQMGRVQYLKRIRGSVFKEPNYN